MERRPYGMAPAQWSAAYAPASVIQEERERRDRLDAEAAEREYHDDQP